MTRLIDMHAHFVPSSFPEAPATCETGQWPTLEDADSAEAKTLVHGPARFTVSSVFFDAEQRLTAMDAQGVDAEVISPLPPMLNYRLRPDDGRALATHVNEFIAELCRVEPARLFGMGTVPLQDPDLAAAALSDIVDLGLDGVEIGSNIAGRSLGEDRFLGFFQEAERLGLPIFVHPVEPALGDRLPRTATGTFGFATDVSLAVASIITGGTAERCPGLRLAFSHGGGGFPLMLPRAQYFWSGTWNEEPPRTSRERPAVSPVDYARRFFYDTLVFDHRAIRYLVDLLGPRQLLVGTDFPAQPREQPAAATLRGMDLPGSVIDDITWHNALRFLGRAPENAAAPPFNEHPPRSEKA